MYFIVCLRLVVVLISSHVLHTAESSVIGTPDSNSTTNLLVDSFSEVNNLTESFSEENLTEFATRRNESIIQPPLYLSLIYQTLLELQKTSSVLEDGSGPIIRALFPISIQVGEFGSVLLSYKSSLNKIQRFKSAHLILTINEEANITNQGHFHVNIQFQNKENILNHRIWESKQFVIFNISHLLNQTFQENEQFTSFDIKCDVFRNIRKRKTWFERVFDTEMEKPFILLEYHDFKIPEFQDSESNRNRRSVASTPMGNNLKIHYNRNDNEIMKPAAQPPPRKTCQRQEWLVSPAEIGLDGVLAPNLLDLGFCSGTCPYPLMNDMFNFTLHSYFIDQHRLSRGFRLPQSFPVSTCVPVQYRQITIMQEEEDGNLIVKSYKDGAVVNCGCR